MTTFNSRRFLVLIAVLVTAFASIAAVSAQKESVPVTTKAITVNSAAARTITGVVTARDAFYLTVGGVNFDVRALVLDPAIGVGARVTATGTTVESNYALIAVSVVLVRDAVETPETPVDAPVGTPVETPSVVTPAPVIDYESLDPATCASNHPDFCAWLQGR